MKNSALPITRTIVQRLRKMRRDRGLSAQAFAQLMTNSGYPVTREAIAAAENDYRKEISVDWLWAASTALGVPVKIVWYGPDCTACEDAPPSGFTCNVCGKGGS